MLAVGGLRPVWAQNRGQINGGINRGVKSHDQRVSGPIRRPTLGALVMSGEPDARGRWARHCRRGWPKKDAAVSEVDVGIEGVAWLAFLGRCRSGDSLGTFPTRPSFLADFPGSART